MVFPAKILRLVSVRTIQKNDKKYTFVKLADKETYDNNDFMLAQGIDPTGLIVNQDYNSILDVEDKFMSIRLTPAPVAGK